MGLHGLDGHQDGGIVPFGFLDEAEGGRGVGRAVGGAGRRQGQVRAHLLAAVQCPGHAGGFAGLQGVCVLEHGREAAAEFGAASRRHDARDDTGRHRVGDPDHRRMLMRDPDQGAFLERVHVLGVGDEHERLQRDGAGEGQQFKDVALAGAEPVEAGLHDVPDLTGQGDGAVAQEPHAVLAEHGTQLDLFPGQGMEEQSVASARAPERPGGGQGEPAAVFVVQRCRRLGEVERSQVHPPEQVILPQTHDVAANMGHVHARSQQRDMGAGAQLGHHHARELVQVMCVVDEEDDSPPL